MTRDMFSREYTRYIYMDSQDVVIVLTHKKTGRKYIIQL
jgi:hypothetical protein